MSSDLMPAARPPSKKLFFFVYGNSLVIPYWQDAMIAARGIVVLVEYLNCIANISIHLGREVLGNRHAPKPVNGFSA